jgi:hypothetical protein
VISNNSYAIASLYPQQCQLPSHLPVRIGKGSRNTHVLRARRLFRRSHDQALNQHQRTHHDHHAAHYSRAAADAQRIVDMGSNPKSVMAVEAH